jgi:hypothetical protein
VCDVKKRKVYAYGTNMYNTDLNTSFRKHTPQNVHAEVNAIEKLPPNNNKNKKKLARPKKVDVIVFRVVGSCSANATALKCGMAKSCTCCRHHLSTYLPKKGYTLRSLYYTDATGRLVRDSM